MNKVKVAVKLLGDGVTQRTDRLLASIGVLVDREVGVKELVGLAHGDRDTEPVSGGRNSSSRDSNFLEPSVHGIDGLLGRSDELFDLLI